MPRVRVSTEFAPGLNGRGVAREARPRPWQVDAACMTHPEPDLWFPEPGHEGRVATAEARAICARCPAQFECLAYGISEEFGIWGGTTERQRRQIRGLLARYGHRGDMDHEQVEVA